MTTAHPRQAEVFTFTVIRGRSVALMACSSCGSTAEASCASGPASREGLLKKFKRLGWSTDGRHPRKNRCPSCSGSATKLELVVRDKMPEVLQLKPAEPQPLSGDQRSAVRRLLDEFFDDGKGQYLEGYSDQRIGREVGVPFGAVKQIREIGYGALKSDPALDAFVGDLAGLRNEAEQVARAIGELHATQQSLEKRQGAIRDGIDRLGKEAANLKERFKP